MFDHDIFHGQDVCGEGTVLHQICSFIAEHGIAIENAAGLLGGESWEHRVARFRADLAAHALSERRALRELNAFLALLSLERVGYVNADESAYFGLVEPDDPRVHGLCLLSDRLEDFVVELEAFTTPGGRSAAA